MKELSTIDSTIITTLVEKRDRVVRELTEALNGYITSIAGNYGVAGKPRVFNNELGLLCIGEEPRPVQAEEVVEGECQKSMSESEG